MAKLTLALLLAVITASEASSVLQHEGGVRRLKTKKSKDNKDNKSSDSDFPTCSAASKKSGSKGKSNGGCSSKASNAESGSVECGETYKTAITLTSSLLCEDMNGGSVALTLSGEDAVLDCSGFSVSSGEKKFAKNVVGIKLEDGASAMNCIVKGFEDGFLLVDGE